MAKQTQKIRRWCAMALLLWAGKGMAVETLPPLQPIPGLDVPRYMGTWYEIAKYPNRFQKQCVGETSARYQLAEDGSVVVINRCRNVSGGFDEAVGYGRPLAGGNSAQLQVRFAPAWLSFLPMVWGDYWVVDLDPDYQLAAISEPKREYLWVLSRTQRVNKVKYQQLLERLQAQGMDLSRVQLSGAVLED